MSVQSLLISGPSHGGKSTLAQLLSEFVFDRPAHYLRLQPATDAHTNVVLCCDRFEGQADAAEWASVHGVTYTADRLFETIPDGLRAVRKLDRFGMAVVEADADPALRHVYPYDFRMFVMPSPTDVSSVFREPEAAASALQSVLQDTAAFASEIFGVFDNEALDDRVGVEHYRCSDGERTAGQCVERLNIDEAQIRHFLNSPLGAEIVARIQLQPDYHALVEADVVLVNIDRRDGGCREVLDECVCRLQKLLTGIRQDARRQSVLYWGDLREDNTARRKLLQRIKVLLKNDD